MTSEIALLSAVMLALTAAGSAHAQRATGTRLGPKPADISGARNEDDRVRQTMYSYAECVFTVSRKGVEKYLSTFPGSDEGRKIAQRLSTSECLSSGELRFKDSLFRGGIYDLLYKADFRDDGPLNFADTPKVDYSIGDDRASNSTSLHDVFIREVADCTVRSGPAEARALIMTKVTTKAENKAFSAVVPHMSGCLNKSVTFKFSKAILRGVVSEALYRLSSASKVAVKGGSDA